MVTPRRVVSKAKIQMLNEKKYLPIDIGRISRYVNIAWAEVHVLYVRKVRKKWGYEDSSYTVDLQTEYSDQ